MRFHTLSEIKKIAENGSYKHFSLADQTGNTLISYNALTTGKSEKLKEIEARLKGEGSPEGIYQFMAKNSARKNITPDIFYYKKGNFDTNKTDITPVKSPNLSEQERVLTYNGALDMQKQIAEKDYQIKLLTDQNTFLNSRISELENDLSDMEDEEEEPSDLMSEGKTLLSQFAPSLLGIAENFFALKNRELDLKQQFLNKAGSAKIKNEFPGANGSDNKQELSEDEKFTDQLMELAQRDPEKYAEVMKEILENRS